MAAVGSLIFLEMLALWEALELKDLVGGHRRRYQGIGMATESESLLDILPTSVPSVVVGKEDFPGQPPVLVLVEGKHQ
jgi:hypothetical protein